MEAKASDILDQQQYAMVREAASTNRQMSVVVVSRYGSMAGCSQRNG